MNKSIRILNLPLNVIKRIEEHDIFRISELINSNLSSLSFDTIDINNISETLEEYKYNELKKEFSDTQLQNDYEYLDEKYHIDDLNLSLRSYNALINNNVNSISKLIQVIEDMEVYNLENLGSKSIVQVMEKVNVIVLKEKLDSKTAVYQKTHIYDDLTVQQMRFSQGAITSLLNLKIDNLGKIRKLYLSGKLAEFFNYKTLKVIIDEFSKYFNDKKSKNFDFFKLYLKEKLLGKIDISELNSLSKEDDRFVIDTDKFIDKIKNNQDLIVENDYIRLPYLKEKLKTVKLKKESRAILIERFNGQTLQSVADKFKKTRERIRQIVRDRMMQISMFFEEGYIKEYNKYVWHSNVFKKVYQVNDFSFNVIKYLGTKFSFEEENIFPEKYVVELFEKNIVEEFDIEEFKTSLPNVFHPRIEIYGQTVEKMTKRGFLEYVIEHFIPRDGIHKFKIVAKANQVSKDNNLDYHYDKYIDIVTNTVQGLQSIRYYDYSVITDELVEELKKILYGVDSVYSCTFFYNKYRDLMDRLDIRDGYELHFILRRLFAKSEEFDSLIDFNRQPMIAIKGKTYSDVVVEKWQELVQPIDLDEFANKLINDFGYHSGTLINIINLTLGDYISLRVLYNNKPNLSKELLKRIKSILVDDFYELSELANILKENDIKVKDYQYFSNYWLKELGYKTHDVNYIIKEDFTSLKDVFFSKVLKNDTYKISKKDHMMRETTLILFIETLRQEYLAFPTKNNIMLSMRHLESKGIKEEDVKNYVKGLTNYLPKEQYFTYESLLKEEYYLKDPAFLKIENFKLCKELISSLGYKDIDMRVFKDNLEYDITARSKLNEYKLIGEAKAYQRKIKDEIEN